MLDQAVAVSADGGTTPAVSLMPFYERKEKVETFIIVTDEEENGRCKNMWSVGVKTTFPQFPSIVATAADSFCWARFCAFSVFVFEQFVTFLMCTSHYFHRFSELYDKYHKEVHPARLVFVSFLRAQHAAGQMVSSLNRLGYKPLQFKFHQYVFKQQRDDCFLSRKNTSTLSTGKRSRT